MSAFAGALDLREVDDGAGDAEEREGRPLWRLLDPLSYKTRTGHLIVVPAGFVTDLASIPQFAWSLGFGPAGRWNKPSVVHDYLYATRGQGGIYTRAQADAIFDEAMALCGVPTWRRAVMWAAVRLGGAGGWGR